MNYMICWMEKDIQKWAMIKKEDFEAFGMDLLKNKEVNQHTIFIIPESSIMSGIWLVPETHKSNRVDFFRFHEDFSIPYKKPEISKENEKIMKQKKIQDDTKYGFVSPDGRYFHCGYQGHSNLADKICFGMIETNNPERYLEEHGWCKIFKSLFDERYCVYVGGKYTLTDAQMKTLLNMGLDNAEGLSEALCKDIETER